MAKPQPTGAPGTSRRVAQREGTRRRLLAAARKAFHLVGVEQVSMEEVAILAEVSRATVYLHFPGKPALLKALLQEDWERQVRLFERLANVQVSSEEELNGWVLRVAEGMRRARDSFGIHWAALGQNPELIVLHHEHRGELARLLMNWVGGSQAQPAPEILIEAELVVAELEHFATAAAVSWTDRQLAAALPLVASRIRKLAGKSERSAEVG